MKIVHLLGSFRLPRHPDRDGYSGIARATLELARTQVLQGQAVTVVSVGPNAWQEEWQGVRLKQLRHQPWARLPGLDLSVHLPYLLLTYRERFDVIHGQMYPSLRWLRGRVRVTHFHSDPADLSLAVVKRAVASSHAQIGVSGFVTDGLRRHLPGHASMQTIPNGVDLAQFSPVRWAHERIRLRAEWGCRPEDVVFLYAGAVVPEKGLLPLGRAYARLRARLDHVHLVVAGDSGLWDLTLSPHDSGDHDAQLQAALEGTPGVQRLGRVQAQGMAAVYAACDVLVVPSLVSETFSLSGVEGMASGLPLVVSDSGALPDLIRQDTQPDVTGLLVPPGDEAALEAALHRMSSDAPFRRAAATHAQKRAAGLSWAWAAEQVQALYLQLASRPPVPQPPAPAPSPPSPGTRSIGD